MRQFEHGPSFHDSKTYASGYQVISLVHVVASMLEMDKQGAVSVFKSLIYSVVWQIQSQRYIQPLCHFT